jgi:tetratricopeptide (TPR) repeat protein
MSNDPRVSSLLLRWQHLRQHEGTPSLDELCAGCPELADVLARQIDALESMAALLSSAVPATTAAPHPLPSTLSNQVLPEQAGRFRLLGQIARGGMGVVLRAHDPEIGRDVAVKLILSEHRDDPEVRRRFLAEARLAGQLQHPCIAPMYDLGHLPDGRPYFAMKLIHGRTLAELLAERTDPAHDLPRFLRYFEAVCQAVGYAHSCAVIHRDLKPANIMVGAFGEVQVMDWGLAKVLAERRGSSPPSEADHQNQPGGSPVLTHPDQVVGTPAYLPPEQARQESQRLDARSDVFGLGGILCEVLTGAPPFRGKELMDVLVQSYSGDLSDAFARLDRCGADAELIRLAKRCLAAQPAERFADGAAVADAVAAYLAGVQQRLRQAELAQARAEEQRKRRKLALALTASALLTLAVLAGTGWYLREQRLQAETAQTLADAERTRQVDSDLLEVAEQRRLGRPERGWEALQRAEGRLSGSTDEELKERVRLVREEMQQSRRVQALLAALEEARLQRAAPGPDGFDDIGADRLFRRAFADFGVDVEALSPAEAAKRLAALALTESLIAALDDWALALNEGRGATHVFHVVDRLDPNEWRRRLRQAFAKQDREAIRQLTGKVIPDDLSPSSVRLVVRTFRFIGEPKKGLRMLREAQRRNPSDFWLCFDLALTAGLSGPEGRHDALRYSTAALALRPRSAAVYYNMGIILTIQGELAEAEAAFKEAIRLNPALHQAHTNLGVVLRAQGRLVEAVVAYKQAIRLNPNHHLAYTNLGVALQVQGKLAEAVIAFQKAIHLNPDSHLAHNHLAFAFKKQGKLDEAAAVFKQVTGLKPNSHEAHYGLGTILLAQRQLVDAQASLNNAIRLKPDYHEAHNNLGIVLVGQGKLVEAVAAFKGAIRFKPDYHEAHNNLGTVLRDQGNLTEAVAAFKKAIRCKPDYPEARNNLGATLLDQGKLPEAVAALREAIRLKPDYHEAQFNLGNALGNQRKFAEAVTAFKEAIRLKPDFHEAHFNLGNTLYKQGKLAEAVAAFNKAIRFKPDDHLAHFNLGVALVSQGKFREALASMRKSRQLGARQQGWPTVRTAAQIRDLERLVELDRDLPDFLSGKRQPSSITEMLDLVFLCTHPTRRFYVASVRFNAAAFKANPDLTAHPQAGYRYNAACFAALAAAREGNDATALNDQARAALRQQALNWLRADLQAWRSVHASGNAPTNAVVARHLQHWRSDTDLAGVRDKGRLAALPEPERSTWAKLWADVYALRQRASR